MIQESEQKSHGVDRLESQCQLGTHSNGPRQESIVQQVHGVKWDGINDQLIF